MQTVHAQTCRLTPLVQYNGLDAGLKFLKVSSKVDQNAELGLCEFCYYKQELVIHSNELLHVEHFWVKTSMR